MVVEKKGVKGGRGWVDREIRVGFVGFKLVLEKCWFWVRVREFFVMLLVFEKGRVKGKVGGWRVIF